MVWLWSHQGGGGDTRNGHGLDEELEGLVEVGRHMFQDHAGDSVLTRCFVVWDAPESLLHDGRGDAARDHRDYVLMVVRNAKVSWERCSAYGRVGSGERAWVSSFRTCAITSAGSTKRRS